MMTRILPIKSDNTIVLFSVECDEKKLKDFLTSLNSRYAYKEKRTITTTMIHGKLLSAGKYDEFNNTCYVEDNFNILEHLGYVDQITEIVKAEIKVSYYSMISKIIGETFQNNSKELIINLTDLIKLSNHVCGFDNSFIFNRLLDVKSNKKGKAWNDKSIRFFSNKEYVQYIENLKRTINIDDIYLNKIERKVNYDTLKRIINNLRDILVIEEIGVYPVQNVNEDIYRILTEFGKRNEDFRFFYDILTGVKTNINGVTKFKNMKEQIEKYYNIKTKEEKILEQINQDRAKIKRFLQDY